MSNTGLAGEWEEWKWGIKLQGENFLIMTKISFLAVSFSQSIYCHKCHNSLNVSTSVKYMKYHDLFIFFISKMILQTIQMHSEMGFNWHGILYMVFCISKMTKRNTFKFIQLLQQHGKGNWLLLNSCSLIPAKWKKTSCSAQWLRFVCSFLELKCELEHICINSILFMLHRTETMKNNGMMLESYRSWF